MTRNHLETGREGELFAAEYLKCLGYSVVDRNHKINRGELDIIALAPDKTLVFVEVKTVLDPGDSGISAENQMSAGKRRKFEKAASLYAGSHQSLIDEEKGWRLDLIALTKYGNSFAVRHYQNI